MCEARRVLDELDLGGELRELVELPPQTDRQGVCVQGALDEAAHQTPERLFQGRNQIEGKRASKLVICFTTVPLPCPC